MPYDFAVPSAGPTIASAVRTSDTSADVTWTPLSLALARGVVTSYSVKYRSMTSQSEDCSASDASSWTAMPSTTSATSLIIVGLNPSRGYCVAVAATTSAGTGPYGTPGRIPSKLSTSVGKSDRSSTTVTPRLHPSTQRKESITKLNNIANFVHILPMVTNSGAGLHVQ